MTLNPTGNRKQASQLGNRIAEQLSVPLLSMIIFGGTITAPVLAEGSREMVADGGDRPFTEWASTTTANIPRQTLLQVYVQAGETIYLGSSVHDSANNPGDIVYRTPSGTTGTCDVLSSGFGFIDTVAKETAGPAPLDPAGYSPCVVNATETGIYEVEFRAPSTSGNPPTTTATEAFPTGSSQDSGVAAWDITVAGAGGVEQTGRVFTNYVALNMGNNSQNLTSDFYVQTWDGYLYRTDMNDVDPYGFISAILSMRTVLIFGSSMSPERPVASCEG